MFCRLRNYIIVIFIAYLFKIESRRYDVEEEAKRLFGDNIDTVLTNFRRSPQYMVILNNEINNLNGIYERNLVQYKFIFLEECTKNLKIKIFGNNTESKPTTDACCTDKPNARKKKKGTRRAFDFNGTLPDVNMTSEEYLRDYVPTLFAREFTSAEVNSFTNEAFKYVGYLIHEMIRAFSDETGKSTKSLHETPHPEHHTAPPTLEEFTTKAESTILQTT